MSLQSFGFFGFLLVVAAVYLHLPQRWQSAFLLAASWVFYALAMPSMLGVTIAIAVFTYLCGRGMAARSSAHKTRHASRREFSEAIPQTTMDAFHPIITTTNCPSG